MIDPDFKIEPDSNPSNFPENLKLGDFLDVNALQAMMEDLYELTEIGIGIIDLEGKILIATGWQDICLKFHRVHQDCLNFCIESDTILSAPDGNLEYKAYKCKNNMWDISTPIIIGGRHMGNIFLGQFFYDDEYVDVEVFKKQAIKYNFNEEEYLDALRRVPRWSRKKVEAAIRYYTKLANQISYMSFTSQQLRFALKTTAKLNASLSDSEKKYRKLFETMSQGVVYQMADGTITDANPAAQEILGLSLDQLRGRTSVDPRWHSIHEDGSDFPGDTHPAIVALQTGRPVNNVIMGVYHPQDNCNRWILVNAVPEFREGDPIPWQVCSTFSDITAIKTSEELISKKNEENDLYFNTSLDMLCIANTQGEFIRLNPVWEDVLGYTLKELEGRFFLDFIHPDDLPATLDAISRLKRQEEVMNFENRYRCKDGSWRWIEWRSKPAGTMIYAAARDITARKKIESDLKLSEEKYRSLVNVACEIILVLQDDKICFFNKKTIELSGYSEEDLMSKPFMDFIYPEDQAVVMDRTLLRRAGIKVSNSFEFRFVSKTGDIVWVLNNSIPIEWEGRPATLTLLTDITGLKKTTEALVQSESRFREMTDLLPQIIFETDLQGNLTFVNQQAYKMMGYKTNEEVIGLSSMTFHTLEERSRALENIRRKMAGQSLLSSEYNMLRKDGTTFPALVYSNHFRKNGKPAGLRGLIVDITDVKHAQNLLREANSYLENLLNYANAPIIVWDSMFCITRFNHAFEHITGLYESEVLGKPLNILFPPDQVESSMEKIRQTQTGQRWETVEIEIQHINKSVRTVLWNSATIFDKEKPVSTIAQGQDITEHKKAQDILKASEEKYRILTENSTDVIWVLNLTTNRFTYISPAIFLLRGLTVEEARNETLEDSMTADSLKMVRSKLEEKVHKFMDDPRDPLPSVDEIQQPHKDGHLVWVEVATRFSLNGRGELEVVGSSRNIDKRKAIEQELLTAKIQAEAANKAKSEFLANISHEIRTPMNSILGFSEVMMNTTGEAKQKHYLKTILDSGKTLLSLINDILDLSKIEAGRLDITAAPADLSEIVSEIRSLFQYRLQEKNLDLHIDIGDDFPASIVIDEIRIRQILLNLVGNAVKFTDRGFVRIGVRIERQYDELIDFSLAVADSGIGIKETDLERIFGSFNQQSGQDSRKYGGTGLGLTISKRLCELMNGKMSVTSKPGEGSRFVVSFTGIPVSTAATVKGEDYLWDCDQIIFKGSGILVVDDVSHNRHLVLSFLENYNLNIFEAENDESAIFQVNTCFPDLILMDIRMRGKNGFETALEIKSNPATSRIPIIALTASAMQDETETFMQAFDGFLRKPIRKNILIAELRKFLPHEIAGSVTMPNPGSLNVHQNELPLPITAVIKSDFKRLFGYELKVQAGTMITGELNLLAGNLVSFAEKNKITQLKNHASDLMEYVRNCEFEKIQDSLHKIGELFEI